MDRFTAETSIEVYSHITDVMIALRDHGLPPEMTLKELCALNMMTLCFLRNEVVSASTVVAETHLSKVAVSRYLANWIDSGWVEESIDESDRRRRLYRLSEFALENSHKFVEAILASHSDTPVLFRHKNV